MVGCEWLGGFCFILWERSKDGVGLFVKKIDDDGRKFLIELLDVWAGPFFFLLKNMAQVSTVNRTWIFFEEKSTQKK